MPDAKELNQKFNERFGELLIKDLPEDALRCDFYKDEEGIYYPVINPSGKSYIFLDTLLSLSNSVPR